ncbi:cortex morphogenetic protein CmpA [Paenibacillus albiflavus]|uniref:Cortex morphogenetic protein CmpA n=1 Tax=Paenibacillus albiflavus TaxID=2545760 RepID=A0A4R4ECG2_9BACL|nr:cortex morphogenetic protein CmpA [Paenibacillus albiflavus]TCZ76670.1 cortex morphogenetic protein CmpA [Paenibacillus albiflavus]
MPQWLCNQLMRAYLTKNRKQIRLLNDSWFFYRTRLLTKGQHKETASSTTND